MITRVFGCPIGLTVSSTVLAVSPESIAIGGRLFQQEWTARNPALGSDGLGPLFNAESCATCHHQGGVGGGGKAEFNAKSIGIESIEIYGGRVTSVSLAELVSRFHPGFVQSEGTIINVLPLPHHGGTEMLRQFHDAMTLRTEAEFSESGGPIDAAEVRIANASPIVFEQQVDGYHVRIAARMFGRNTTALFGAGLIDQVPDRLIAAQARIQQAHPEIHGRPSTLRDGRYGKFGWRANVASLFEFTDQACANEMGLQTPRKTQSADPTNAGYRNNQFDIGDEQVQNLKHFVAALPAPKQQFPQSPSELVTVRHGETTFHRVGCSVCHVRDMPPALGIYSDLLLHDMGQESIDLNHAEPYIVKRNRVPMEVEAGMPTGMQIVGEVPYYGPATMIPLPQGHQDTVDVTPVAPVFGYSQGPISQQKPSFAFVSPEGPTSLVGFQLIGSELNPDTQNNSIARKRRTSPISGGRPVVTRFDFYDRLAFQPTRFNQEWRTAPLWGLRDSAPYLHDGRAETILEAIAMHDGEASGTRDRFLSLGCEE